MPQVTNTEHHIKEVYQLLNSYRPSKTKEVGKLDAAVSKLVEDKLSYQTDIDTLYYERSFIKKILYFFGFFITAEEKNQMRCIRKINKVVDFVQVKKQNYTPSASELAKASLRNRYNELLKENTFRELLAFSLKSDPSEEEIKAINKKNSGTLFYVPDLYFANVIRDFLKKSSFTSEDSAKVAGLLKAFTFNQNVVWKSTKEQSNNILSNPSYREKAIERLHTSLRKMKIGDEVVFSGRGKVQDEDDNDANHAVLFSCKKLANDNFCLRIYDTSDASSIQATLSGAFWSGWNILRGHDAEITIRRNFKIAVDQSFLSESSLLSKEFAQILTEEIITFNTLIKETDELFPAYKSFVQSHTIASQIANKPVAPQIKFQQGPNCAISSKLAYIEETLGSSLFARFKGFVANSL